MAAFATVTRVTQDYAYVDLLGSKGDSRKYKSNANVLTLQCEGQLRLHRSRAPKLDLIKVPGDLIREDLTETVGDYTATAMTDIVRFMHFMHRIPVKPVQAALLKLASAQDFIIPASKTAIVCKGRIAVGGVPLELHANLTTVRTMPAKALADTFCLLLG